ncbi:MAG TPA: alkaline phosphatase family protein [Candidatus Cybelea sp.]|nr:alkaline phosphatase family protein [Candidatus Cybelea sp.]
MNRFRSILALAAAAAIADCNSSNAVPQSVNAAKPIQHVVILMQENRSFNTIFAGFPGADTALVGKCEPVRISGQKLCPTGTTKLTPVHLKTGGGSIGRDIDHSHTGFQIECDLDSSGVCRNDGFDKIGFGAGGSGQSAGLYPYSYVYRSETKAYWDFAKQYALADHMFFSQTAASFIAHQIILSGTVALNSHESLTDQPAGMPWGCDDVPGAHSDILKTDGKEFYNGPFPCFTEYGTMADVLDPAHVSWKYYVDDFKGKYYDFSGKVWDGYDAIAKVRCKTWTLPFKSVSDCHGYGSDWANVSMPNTNVFKDLSDGTLPAVSWVIPTLADSDHPAINCNGGPRWVSSVVNAIGRSKYWNSTAVILLWDDWGGWYDPVPPPQTNYTSLGFRVGTVVISPWARSNTVVHTQYEFGSILKFIEQNFGLGSLHTTDETSTSIGDMFNFSQKPTKFVPEPLPHAAKCAFQPGASASEIIEGDGGVPE